MKLAKHGGQGVDVLKRKREEENPRSLWIGAGVWITAGQPEKGLRESPG